MASARRGGDRGEQKLKTNATHDPRPDIAELDPIWLGARVGGTRPASFSPASC